MHMHAPWAVRVWVDEIFFTQYCTVLMILDQVVGVLKWQVCAFQVWILYYVCQYAYMVTRWLYTLHNIILAHHHQNCECDSGFCASCGDVESLSPSTCIWLMLCPPFCIHGSSIPVWLELYQGQALVSFCCSRLHLPFALILSVPCFASCMTTICACLQRWSSVPPPGTSERKNQIV